MSQPSTPNYLAAVKDQYERLPYPPCDPQDEHRRLMRTWLDSLPMINHYCFGGRADFDGGFRVLVAGGGTGDSTIYLAEQLKNTGAEIVHLDLSGASIAIAQQRAAIRRLSNIRWVQQSLLDLPTLGLGQFDYINCSGVLHHLADPDAGLRALLAVLKPHGGMGLMVYGQIGRMAIYQMQELLRLANGGVDEESKLAHAKEVLAGLPEWNWYRRAGEDYGDDRSDAAIYDSLLHSQDRAYTVPQLYEWLMDRHGLQLALTDVNRGLSPYLPECTLAADAVRLRAHLPQMGERERYAMSELLVGDLTRHTLFVTRGAGAAAPYGDADFIPYFVHDAFTGATLAELFAPKDGAPTTLFHQALGVTIEARHGALTSRIFRHIDGRRSFGEIFDLVRAEPGAAKADNAACFADFAEPYTALRAIERILLRHVSLR
jgi:2-polyprenyl-3-methyl-5-hydroxy-6-metoxy-1,4-benzoquinol methylase